MTDRVQGVSYRAYAAQEAVRLQLTGWIRNEPDGSVRAQFEGEDDRVDQMITWCERGSPNARVTHVDVCDAEPTNASGFEAS